MWVPTRQEGTHKGCPYTRTMLTESEQLLICAAVDGVLTPAEAKAFDRLLASNPEAGRLFRRLKGNAARLAALPKRRAPQALAAKVMARVRPITPARRTPSRTRSLIPFAIAASLFLAVTAGSFLFFHGKTAASREQAQRDQLPPPGNTTVAPDVPMIEPVAFAKAGAGEDGLGKAAGEDGAVAKMIPEESPPVVVVQAPKKLTPEEVELIGSALMIESKPLKEVNPTLPLLFSALEFDQPDQRERLKKELAKDAGFRLNLFSKNTAAAAEQVQAAARSVGVNVFVEGMTAERIKKPMPLGYGVYVENLTADDLAALFAALSKQVNTQSRPETILGAAHFVPADVPEQKDLKERLGLDWQFPKAAKPADAKSVSEGTLKEVVASVKKPGEKVAVVFTDLARLNAGKSAEVKQFVEKKGERKPGTVPLLIVIRPQP